MGCASSVNATAAPGSHPQYATAPHAATPTPEGGGGAGDKQKSNDGASSTLARKVLSASELVAGAVLPVDSLVALQRSLAPGSLADAVSVLVAVYSLWNAHSASHKSRWAAESIEYLQSVEADLLSAQSHAAWSSAHYLSRIHAELTAAQITLRRTLEAGMLTDAFLQSEMANHKARLEAIRAAALLSITADAALDVRQTSAIMVGLLAGSAADPTDARGPQDSAAGPQGGQRLAGAIFNSALEDASVHTNASPQVAEIFNLLSTIGGAIQSIRVCWNQRNGAKGKAGDVDAASEHPLAWLVEFEDYLAQVARELTQARMVLETPSFLQASNSSSNSSSGGSPAQDALSKLTLALEDAQEELASISRSQRTSVGLVSSFLSLVSARSDSALMRRHRLSIEAAKAGLLSLVLTAMQREQNQLLDESYLGKLKAMVSAQSVALAQAQSLADARSLQDRVFKALAPVDCSMELRAEHRRFMKGTRASVMRRFATWIGEGPAAVDSASAAASSSSDTAADPASSSPLFLLLASPGHGKTVLASHLVESHPSRALGAHFFKFDMASRRGANRALRSMVWQLVHSVPQILPFVVEALEKAGVDVHEVRLKFELAAAEAASLTGPAETNPRLSEEAALTARRMVADNESKAAAASVVPDRDTRNGVKASTTVQGGSAPKAAAEQIDVLERLNLWDLWEQLLAGPLWKVDEARKASREKVAEQKEPDEKTNSAEQASDAPIAAAAPPAVLSGRVFLLFDALDESEGGGSNLLLKLLSHLCTPGHRYALPPWVGVVVSSRPEAHIVRALSKAVAKIHPEAVVNLDELDRVPSSNGVGRTGSVVRAGSVALSSSAAVAAAAGSENAGAQQSDLRYFFEAVLKTFMPLPSEIAAAASSASTSAASAAAVPASSPVLESAPSLSPEAQRAKCLDTLLRKSQGMFLYARLILEQRGLDLSKLGVELVDDPSTPDVDESLVAPVRLTPEDIDGFPSGLNNFYLDLLRRAAGPDALASGSSGSRSTPSALSDLMSILSGMVVALEPLSLLQMAQMLRLKGWEEVVRKSEKIRSVVQIKPMMSATVADDGASAAGSASGALNPSSVLQLFHRSIRDWLVSSTRAEDRDESLFFIDELQASQALLKRAWLELQAEEPSKDGSALPLLRVADCVLPSSLRETPQFRSSFLAYAVAYLPAHALHVAATAGPALFHPVAAGTLTESVRVAADVARESLRILLSTLCHLQYIHIRSCSDLISLVVAAAATATPASKETLPVSTAFASMSQEFSAALALLEMLLEQKKKEMVNATVPAAASSAADSAADSSAAVSSSDPDFVFLSDGVALLKAFQRFARSEYAYLQPLEQARTTSSTLLSCATTLTVLYQQALSYPASHPVTQQCVRLGEWLREWRIFAQEDTQEILGEIAAAGGQTVRRMQFTPSTTTPLSNAEASINWRRSNSALARGWVTWLDKPTELSPCVAIVRGVGNVISLACAVTPSLPGLFSATSQRTLFAAAHTGGTFEVFDLASMSRIHSGMHGTFVAFDCRPATAVESEAAALAEGGADAESDLPFQLVSCSPYEWSCLDLSPSATGEMWSQKVGWAAATTHQRILKKQQQRGGGGGSQPFEQNSRDLRWAAAPLRDRSLLVQFNSSDSTETLLSNRGMINAFPRSSSGIPEGSKVIAVSFSHDGLLVFVSVERIPWLIVFGCDEYNASRAPTQLHTIGGINGNAHATCMVLTLDDNTMARGGSDGMVGVWRRTRTQVTHVNWSGEESFWAYEPMAFVSRAIFPATVVTPVASVSLTEPRGDRLLAGMMHNVLLFSTVSRQCLAVFFAELDPLGGVALTPSGQYALCGGGGVDKCVRIWELPSAAQERDITARVVASQQAGTAQSNQGVIPAAPAMSLIKCAVRTLFFHREVDLPDQSLFWNDNAGIHHLRQRVQPDGSWYAPAADKASIPVRSRSRCRVAAVSPTDPSVIVCGSNYKDLELWSLTPRTSDGTSQEASHLLRPLLLSESLLTSDAFLPAVLQLDRSTGELMSFSEITSVRFTPCGRFLLAAGNLWDLLVWEVRTGELVHCQPLNMDQPKNSSYLCYEIHTMPIARDSAAMDQGYSQLYLTAVCPQDVLSLWKITVWEEGRGPVVTPKDGTAALSAASSASSSPQHAVPKRKSIEFTLEWERQLDQLTAFGRVRGLLIYQPLLSLGSAPDAPQPDALILMGDSLSVLQIRRLRDGEQLYAFSTAPSMVHTSGSEGNGIMQLMIVDRSGVHGSGTNERIEAASAGAAADGDVVQLVTLNERSGLCFWVLGPLLRSLAQAGGPLIAQTRNLAPRVDFPSSAVPTLRSKGEGYPPSFPLYPPPQLRAQIQCSATLMSRFALDRCAQRVALANIDGAVFVFHWKDAHTQEAATASSSDPSSSAPRDRGVVEWHGLFEFHPAQRAELSGLISQMQCEAQV